jgi:hypothetical protein
VKAGGVYNYHHTLYFLAMSSLLGTNCFIITSFSKDFSISFFHSVTNQVSQSQRIMGKIVLNKKNICPVGQVLTTTKNQLFEK